MPHRGDVEDYGIRSGSGRRNGGLYKSRSVVRINAERSDVYLSQSIGTTRDALAHAFGIERNDVGSGRGGGESHRHTPKRIAVGIGDFDLQRRTVLRAGTGTRIGIH